MRPEEIFWRDREVLGGELVCAGTRVPVRTLVEHLAAGDSLEDFLEGFPGVRREQAVAFLGWALAVASWQAGGKEGMGEEEAPSREDVVGRLKGGFAHVPESRVLSEELIAERRKEALREEGGGVEGGGG